jgi:formylglycine-generating enzyme required for sulfatase activity
MTSGSESERKQILDQQIYIGGANRPFRDVTLADARARADELRAATGFGPTARVAPVARAWRELAMAMEGCGAATVGELDTTALTTLAPKLWIVMPGL